VRLYPHQWLWDSCFTAIGIARFDPTRAADELRALFRGQWENGMLPHMIFAEGSRDVGSRRVWRSRTRSGAPRDVATTCILRLAVKIPALLDGIDNGIERAYTGWPDRLYIIGTDGRIHYKSAPGPFGFSTEALEALLSGRDPTTGTTLGYPLRDRTSSNGSVIRAVAGFDATLSAPKSLSASWAVTGDGGLVECHDIAVAAVVE